MSNWPVGTVAVATIKGVVGDVRVMRIAAGGGSRFVWVGGTRIGGNVGYLEDEVTDVRPLVVLDFAEIEPPHVVIDHLRGQCASHREGAPACEWARIIADQIEAQTRPPKPAEPTGLGAVVEVDGGVPFVRNPDGVWVSEDDRLYWREMNVVRVLSEGVTS